MKTTKPKPANCLECSECIPDFDEFEQSDNEYICNISAWSVIGQGIPEWCPKRRENAENDKPASK